MTNANVRESAHPIDAMFLARWSPRAFNDEVISEADLLTPGGGPLGTLLLQHPALAISLTARRKARQRGSASLSAIDHSTSASVGSPRLSRTPYGH
jgi:hypothetical protein